MISNMKKTVDPCDNFYEFACGYFDDPSSSSLKFNKYIDQADKNMDARIKDLIINSRQTFEFEPFKFINDFYYSCKNMNNYHRK